MSSDQIAQCTFLLFVTRDRAEAIVHQLRNDTRSHVSMWFWCHVVHAAIGLGWKTFLSRPVWAIIVVIIACTLSVLAMESWSYLWLKHPVSRNFTVSYLWYEFFILLKQIILPFVIGLILAWLARGQEIAICVVSGLVLNGIYSYPQYYFGIHGYKPLLSVGMTIVTAGIVRLLMFFLAGAAVRSFRIRRGGAYAIPQPTSG